MAISNKKVEKVKLEKEISRLRQKIFNLDAMRKNAQQKISSIITKIERTEKKILEHTVKDIQRLKDQLDSYKKKLKAYEQNLYQIELKLYGSFESNDEIGLIYKHDELSKKLRKLTLSNENLKKIDEVVFQKYYNKLKKMIDSELEKIPDLSNNTINSVSTIDIMLCVQEIIIEQEKITLNSPTRDELIKAIRTVFIKKGIVKESVIENKSKKKKRLLIHRLKANNANSFTQVISYLKILGFNTDKLKQKKIKMFAEELSNENIFDIEESTIRTYLYKIKNEHHLEN